MLVSLFKGLLALEYLLGLDSRALIEWAYVGVLQRYVEDVLMKTCSRAGLLDFRSTLGRL
jgi:hypothetical protein